MGYPTAGPSRGRKTDPNVAGCPEGVRVRNSDNVGARRIEPKKKPRLFVGYFSITRHILGYLEPFGIRAKSL